jgi:molybdopterin molybdotransferase
MRLARGVRKVRNWTASIGATTVPVRGRVGLPERQHAGGPGPRGKGLCVMTGFDTIVVADWSARSAPSPRGPARTRSFSGSAATDMSRRSTSGPGSQAMRSLRPDRRRAQGGRRILAAFDFPFAYPNGFARAVTGEPTIRSALWARSCGVVEDDDRNGNNRFEVAARLNNAGSADGTVLGSSGWPRSTGLPFRKPGYAPFPFAEKRRIETLLPRAKSCFSLWARGRSGRRRCSGSRVCRGCASRYGEAISVAPFEAAGHARSFWPSATPVCSPTRSRPACASGEIPDRAQVRILAHAFPGCLPPAWTHCCGRRPGRGLDPRPWCGGRDRRRAALSAIAGP